ncbi:hypothetical protein CIB48_g2453 [Xylaria polymorpha]|nr:hypothetical protein CIB48_g2453 [Xylaria polymorpha]
MAVPTPNEVQHRTGLFAIVYCLDSREPPLEDSLHGGNLQAGCDGPRPRNTETCELLVSRAAKTSDKPSWAVTSDGEAGRRSPIP